MVVSVSENDMELWLTEKGFVFLAAHTRDESLVVQGGICPDYTVSVALCSCACNGTLAAFLHCTDARCS